MSQLLCEQVVGRGLRRTNYNDVDENGRFREEVATVFGVPFEVIPFKASKSGGGTPRQKRFHVHALPSKAQYEIQFPRVEGYTQAIRNRVTVNWESVPTLPLEPDRIPPEVGMKGLSVNTAGRLSLTGPGRLNEVDLSKYRAERRLQEIVFDIATGLTKHYASQPSCEAPAHVLFPQIANIVRCHMEQKVRVRSPADLKDLGLSPYYGWLVEILTEHIHPDTSAGETPEVPLYERTRGAGSTAEVDYWTSKEPKEVIHCHLNYVVPDTKKWEQQAAYYIDKHLMVDAFVKNAGLGFAIPYLHNGQPHDYVPDFIVRLKTEPPIHLVLETKGYDPLAEVKKGAAERWVNAVNADGTYGKWTYAMVRQVSEVNEAVTGATVI